MRLSGVSFIRRPLESLLLGPLPRFSLLYPIHAPPGKKCLLPALLTRLAVAMLAGMRCLQDVAPFGREHGQQLAQAHGFRSRKPPCRAALSIVLRRLDVRSTEETRARWVTSRCHDLGDSLALDSQILRGSARHRRPGVSLLAA
jgi:hypothetical protein